MNIIAFTNHKGGTGKTTSVLNIGKALAAKGNTVLLVDLDSQGNLTYSNGINNFDYTAAEVIAGTVQIEEAIVNAGNLDLLPANFELNKKQFYLESTENEINHLKDILPALNYDFILIDCPPAISFYTLQALNAANYVVIPMLMEVLSVQGLNWIIQIIFEIQKTSNPNLQILGVLAVMVDDRRQLTSEILQFVNNNYFVNVFNNRIRSNVKAAEAPSFGQSVIEYAPNSSSAKDYIDVTNELILTLNGIEQSKIVNETNELDPVEAD